MSGNRWGTFREGDRSEYLANYLMSGLGLITGISRQEDIGVDFYCSVSDQEQGALTFGYPYQLSIKSDSMNSISFGGIDKGKWKQNDIKWLFRQELPLFFGFVSKREAKIDIYAPTALWFLFHEHPTCTEIEFKIENPNTEVGRPGSVAIPNCPSGCGDGNRYTINLGFPIVSLRHSDFENENTIRNIKNILRTTIELEQNNILYRRLNLSYFHWVIASKANEIIEKIGWIYTDPKPDSIDRIIRSIAPSLISLAIHLKQSGNPEQISTFKDILRKCPADMKPPELLIAHGDIFE